MTRRIRGRENSIARFSDVVISAKTSEFIDTYLQVAPAPPPYAAVRQYVLFHTSNLVELLENKIPQKYPFIRRVQTEAPVFQIRTPKKQKHSITGVFAILPGTRSDFHRLVTVSYTPFWALGIRRLVRYLYPDAMPVFFKQNEIRDSLLALEHSLASNRRIRITEVTMKRKKSNDGSVDYRQFETDRLWTELSVDEIFSQAQERNQWFTGIRFKIESKSNSSKGYTAVASARIYKTGEISYDLLHSEMSSVVLPVLEEYAAKRLELLKGRGIRERNYSPGLPIEISYSLDVFENVSEIHRFGDVISKYPNSTKAVYHANPYYHASVADFLDGSSFEVWILSPKRIIIVPQAKSSEQAFQRLIAYIFTEYREGSINEYSG